MLAAPKPPSSVAGKLLLRWMLYRRPDSSTSCGRRPASRPILDFVKGLSGRAPLEVDEADPLLSDAEREWRADRYSTLEGAGHIGWADAGQKPPACPPQISALVLINRPSLDHRRARSTPGQGPVCTPAVSQVQIKEVKPVGRYALTLRFLPRGTDSDVDKLAHVVEGDRSALGGGRIVQLPTQLPRLQATLPTTQRGQASLATELVVL